jgi:hypothetical protein
MAKSLASKSNEMIPVESNPGAGLPAGYGGGNITVSSPIYQSSPYVQFISTKGQAFAEVARRIPDLQDSDPVLLRGADTPPVRLNPLRFHLIAAFQHFSVVDSMGQIVKSTLDVDSAREDRAYKWLEHIESVILVCLGDGGLCPARCTFKTTKTNAAHTAIAALNQAGNPDEWAKQGPDYRASLPAPYAWARFTATVTLTRGTAKGSGFKFAAAKSFITPTGLADWQALAAAFQDEGFKRIAKPVMSRHNERVAVIKSLCV